MSLIPHGNRNNQLSQANLARLRSYAAHMGWKVTKASISKLWQLYKSSGSDRKRSQPNTSPSPASKPFYQGGAPSAYSGRQVARLGQGDRHVVKGSELINSVNGSVAFGFQRYALNPGLSATFPRLSREAAVWQLYTFRKLRFRFVTRTGTDTGGSVILSPCYNPAEQPPADEKEASNTEGAMEDVSWTKSLTCNLNYRNMFPLGNRKQIRYFNVPGDVNIYDAGIMYVCTLGQASTAEIGKLWVDYEVEFHIPQSIPITPMSRDLSFFEVPSVVLVDSAWTALVYTDIPPYMSTNPLGVVMQPGVAAFTLPLGAYRITIAWSVTSDPGNTSEILLNLNANNVQIPDTRVDTHNFHRCTLTLDYAIVVTDPTVHYSVKYHSVRTAGAVNFTTHPTQLLIHNV